MYTYALCIDLDEDALEEYGLSREKAYSEIIPIMKPRGFSWSLDSLFIGDSRDRSKTTPVDCILAAGFLKKELPWFHSSLRELTMLRIDEINDIMILLPYM